MPKEIELKLQLSPQDKARLFEHALLSNVEPKIHQLHSQYYDTPNMDLSRQGYALRIRKDGHRYWQTLKNAGFAEDGMHQRNEWEYELGSNQLDLQKLPADVLREIENFADQLEPAFVTEFQRHTWDLHLDDGQHIEIALDDGKVFVDKWEEPIFELELEIKSGDKSGLIDLASELRKTIQLKPFDVSKAERGYRLFQIAKSNAHAK